MIYPSYFKLHMRWLYYPAHPRASPLWGRGRQHSNLLPADWSFSPVTYLCTLLGISLTRGCLQQFKFVPDKFVAASPLYCNSNYLGFSLPATKGCQKRRA
ncbi:hypothetical protein C3432_17835 [Citrobacter amalonaticus]|uniref:Uncharacterized protein n=1 Tax=Citrobacter amalonaticus TaxID=35703 RepID=A0A2S4RWV2_CITAM|nr:hypothetical protein C3432_17835 [Citrobacter amalonaticus]POT74160.1 hypothetical protein C3436_15475 [Citrobacter amalonaticus]POU64961.1 hypothetical protein C3430_12215 [Citrobacter amalonaticus]POV03795.1 hypothetical protein C3424_17155 [Citrobacter amalonaticus]